MEKMSVLKKLELNIFEDMDQILETNSDLTKLPVQPLYNLIKKLEPQKLSHFLHRFSKTQRVTFLDLDIWNKDELDLTSFPFWILTYLNCTDEEVRFEFCQGPHFALFLKSKFNIWTFDVDDPSYPDHDNYFLTEDNLLLFEFDKDDRFFEEVRSLIRTLYSKLGVEKAYTHLFKIVSELHSTITEEEYYFKKERLKDLGFLDYFEALSVESPWTSLNQVDSFIRQKKTLTGSLGNISKIQSLPKSAVVSFGDSSSDLLVELDKVQSEKRRDFLRFNFLRLINSLNTVNGGLRADSITLSNIGKRARCQIDLGFDYLKAQRREFSLFDIFTFEDIYKIGLSLLRINQGKIKTILKGFEFLDSDPFLGNHLLSFLDESFGENCKLNGNLIDSMEAYKCWEKEITLFGALIPFISKFQKVHKEMIDSGAIQNSFYLNYNVEEMDFEVLIISCFANFILGYFDDPKNRKLGISITDVKKFYNEVVASEVKNKRMELFIGSFGLKDIPGIEGYLGKIIKEHLEGVDLNALEPEEFKHVGGVVILNLQ